MLAPPLGCRPCWVFHMDCDVAGVDVPLCVSVVISGHRIYTFHQGFNCDLSCLTPFFNYLTAANSAARI